MEKNLNEGIEDLLNLDNSDVFSNHIPDISDIILSGKKKRKSILDDDNTPAQQKPEQVVSVPQEIVISKPLADEYQEKVMAQITKLDKTEEFKKLAELRAKKKNKTQEILEQVITPMQQQQIEAQQIQSPLQQFQELNDQVKEELETIIGKELPTEVNFVELEEEIDSALLEIPDMEGITIADLDIKKIPTKKDKTGYFKTKVTIKGENIPDQINKISSYVKSQTKGLLSPRKCDMRVIANTNKTQLRGSQLKLGLVTIVFKPDFEKLKVNKGTRFMISVPEDHATTGNLLVYLQESRNKKILEVTSKDFESIELFNEFIGDRIAEFYFSGYLVTLKKLELRKTNNPLMDVITNILATREYKAKPYTDDDSNIYAIDFISKEDKNQWLYVQVIEADMSGYYDVIAKNSADQTWEYQLTKESVTIGVLLKNLYDILGTCYSRDWTNELNITDEDDNFYYLYDKIKHFKLRKALIILNEARVETPELGVVLKETLSKLDIKKALKTDYDAEAIIGKTAFIDYFILTYLAHQIVGGDKRHGSDYITRQQYYEKYSVKDRREYDERDKTILRKEGADRNYNARIYVFQLEYSVGGKKHIYRDENFENLLSMTGLLTNKLEFPKTKY